MFEFFKTPQMLNVLFVRLASAVAAFVLATSLAFADASGGRKPPRGPGDGGGGDGQNIRLLLVTLTAPSTKTIKELLVSEKSGDHPLAKELDNLILFKPIHNKLHSDGMLGYLIGLADYNAVAKEKILRHFGHEADIDEHFLGPLVTAVMQSNHLLARQLENWYLNKNLNFDQFGNHHIYAKSAKVIRYVDELRRKKSPLSPLDELAIARLAGSVLTDLAAMNAAVTSTKNIEETNFMAIAVGRFAQGSAFVISNKAQILFAQLGQEFSLESLGLNRDHLKSFSTDFVSATNPAPNFMTSGYGILQMLSDINILTSENKGLYLHYALQLASGLRVEYVSDLLNHMLHKLNGADPQKDVFTYQKLSIANAFVTLMETYQNLPGWETSPGQIERIKQFRTLWKGLEAPLLKLRSHIAKWNDKSPTSVIILARLDKVTLTFAGSEQPGGVCTPVLDLTKYQLKPKK